MAGGALSGAAIGAVLSGRAAPLGAAVGAVFGAAVVSVAMGDDAPPQPALPSPPSAPPTPPDYDTVGQPYKFEDMVFWKGKEKGVKFDAAAKKADIIVTGPHAGAVFPAELRPFVSPELTRRQQYDFSDVATGPVGCRWAMLDERIIFVQNCLARVATDANRANSANVERDLREFFRRRNDNRTAFGGVDSVRPVTFSNIPVLKEPQSNGEWQELVAAITKAKERGPSAYEAARDKVIRMIVGKHNFSDANPLTVICLHDTDNFKCAPDGSLTVARLPKDMMPDLVCFGNGGDAQGNSNVLMPREELELMGRAWAAAFGVPSTAVSFNKPYAAKGAGLEARRVESFVHNLGVDYRAVHITQVEFLRKVLHGPRADVTLREPGSDYPAPEDEHVTSVAEKLIKATDKLREERQRVARL